jgi:outer membrane protein OmpA-like peptidoglycan-associated protein
MALDSGRSAAARQWLPLLFLCALALLDTACARTPSVVNWFVLIADPDGTTGEIVVTNEGGSRVIRQARYGVAVVDRQTAPSEPGPLSDEKIAALFGPALAALPEPPARFLLYFVLGSTELTEDSKKLLPEIVAAISRRRSTDISVVGHTDRLGTRERNYQLGLDRATAVRDILIAHGVDAAAIRIDSHGQDNPLIPTADQVPEPRNRRTEVSVR